MSFGDPKTNIQYPNIPAPEHLVPDLEGDQTHTYAGGTPGAAVQPKSDNNPAGTMQGVWTGVMTAEVAATLAGPVMP